MHSDDRSAPTGAAETSTVESRIVHLVQEGQRSFSAGGRWLVLIEARRLADFRSNHQYELVARDEARSLLDAAARNTMASGARLAAFREAAAMLADPAERRHDRGLLLLRRRPTGRARSRTNADVVTPSQLARLVRQDEEPQHWIEIELLFPDGKPVAGERFRIVTPDEQDIVGKTDSRGRARVDSIVASGSCTISFPELYDEEWRLA